MSGVPTGSASPVSAAANPPAASWLSAPMLNKPGAQSERNRETGEGERGRLVQNLAESVGVAPRAFEQQPIHRRR